MKHMRPGQFLLTFLALSGCLYAQAWSGILDPSRAIDWSHAGITGGIPNRTVICSTLNPGATAAQINAAIAACPTGEVVFLNAGTYTLSSGIVFNGISGVTLRGAGPTKTIVKFTAGTGCGGNGGDVCFIDSNPYWVGSSQVLPGGSNACNWTAGFTQGATSITLNSCGSTPPVNQYIILDQANDTSDTGGVYICTSVCNVTGTNDVNGRVINGILHSQKQVVYVTSVSGSGSGPYTVGISPGLYAANWRSGQSPGAWWTGQISMDGIENMTVDHTSTGSSYLSGIYFYDCYQCWVENVRSIKPVRNHVWMYQTARDVVRDSYFYDTQGETSESYGTETFVTSDDLIENTIWQKVAAPLYIDSASGVVFGYNYTDANIYRPAQISVTQVALSSNVATVTGTLSNTYPPSTGQAVYITGTTTGGGIFNVNGVLATGVTGLGSQGASGTVSFPLTGANISPTADSGTMTVNGWWIQVSYLHHGSGGQMNLFEGNVVNGLTGDNYWGSSAVNTMFRNRSAGWQIGQNESTIAIQVNSWNRGYNIIGNVLGTSGFDTQYESSQSVGNPNNCWTTIYALGWPAAATTCLQSTNDPLVRSTLFRWGNYDTVNAAVEWNSSEVPTSGATYINGNAVPSTENLPSSFYRSTQPSAWATPWGTPPWPPIGPDVTGGNISGVGGHANMIPAQLCYNNTAFDTTYGTPVLAFDAATCYSDPVPAPPSNLTAVSP